MLHDVELVVGRQPALCKRLSLLEISLSVEAYSPTFSVPS